MIQMIYNFWAKEWQPEISGFLYKDRTEKSIIGLKLSNSLGNTHLRYSKIVDQFCLRKFSHTIEDIIW